MSDEMNVTELVEKLDTEVLEGVHRQDSETPTHDVSGAPPAETPLPAETEALSPSDNGRSVVDAPGEVLSINPLGDHFAVVIDPNLDMDKKVTFELAPLGVRCVIYFRDESVFITEREWNVIKQTLSTSKVCYRRWSLVKKEMVALESVPV